MTEDVISPSPSNSLSTDSVDNYNDIPTGFARSPHPYRRRKREYTGGSDSPSLSYLPSPALTPQDSDVDRTFSHSDVDRTFSHAAKAGSTSAPQTPGCSGTEADDESLCLTKALTAPPYYAPRGLDQGYNADTEKHEAITFREDSALSSSDCMTSRYKPKASSGHAHDSQEASRTVSRKRQLAKRELSRRQCEALCLAVVGVITLKGVWHGFEVGAINGEVLKPGLTCCGLVIAGLYALYPIRVWLSSRSSAMIRTGPSALPSYFDPAPLLYPLAIPIFTTLSLSSTFPESFLPSVVLGISTLPASLIPCTQRHDGFNALHWVLSLVPATWATRITFMPDDLAVTDTSTSASIMLATDRETIALMYPLHQALLPCLRYLTTTSLLESELQLLAVALLTCLSLVSSPQMLILRYLLWVGGFGLFLLCNRVLKWNVALERVPNWRFRRAAHVLLASKTFLSSLAESVQLSYSTSPDARQSEYGTQNNYNFNGNAISKRRQSAQLPSLPGDDGLPHRRKRTMSAAMQKLLTMTPEQADRRKWFYASYTYIVTIFLILVPVRMLIQSQALQNFEPFLWAIGYLFGDLPKVRSWTSRLGMDDRIPFDFSPTGSSHPLAWVDRLRRHTIGAANTRLLLFAYFAVVVALGITTVILLSSKVAVDTRRKVFHGTMVLLLMPTAFIDPVFVSLGLVLVLAIFLLLEVFRAGQLRPLSKPLAIFLGPYVDGRDLRGPVVISHIFLLIGCAIPFWLSLAGISYVVTERAAIGWELATRDVSMLSGVICVGLGDAAASLIGRRFGRHKWPWAGGKSLEGSLAFTVAVTAGLVASKAWLLYGGWENTYNDNDDWTATFGKASIAAAGASFTEAVLTGCNDNVIVPVVLWLLVRGLHL